MKMINVIRVVVVTILVTDSAIENEMEQLGASVEFLVELCETSAPNRVCCSTLSAFQCLSICF